jgi:mannose-6-phosphate isomerase-like protein (cupin superfamily)
MHVTSREVVEPFTTKDGSTIRELHHTGSQSLAEATLGPGQVTERHYHRRSEEIYVVLEGKGTLVDHRVTQADRR